MLRGSSAVAQALTCYGLTLALAFVVIAAVPWVGEASLLLTMLTPAAAVALMVLVISRDRPLRTVLTELGLTRAGFRAFPVAVGLPAANQAASVAILAAAGLVSVSAPLMSTPIVQLVVKTGLGLIITTLLALCEEVGWRGYMLPRLRQWGEMQAMLAVGFMHGMWHLPLLLGTGYYHSSGNMLIIVPLFLVTLTLAGVFYGVLRWWSGSVWPVAAAHAAANTSWAAANTFMPGAPPLALEYVGGESGLITIAVLAVFTLIIWAQMRRGRLRLAG